LAGTILTEKRFPFLEQTMPVKIYLREKEFLVRHGISLRSALKKLNILSQSVLATRQGELLTEDVMLNDGDVITLIPVISGG
jgi:sulfur carrier protein ThiS